MQKHLVAQNKKNFVVPDTLVLKNISTYGKTFVSHPCDMIYLHYTTNSDRIKHEKVLPLNDLYIALDEIYKSLEKLIFHFYIICSSPFWIIYLALRLLQDLI